MTLEEFEKRMFAIRVKIFSLVRDNGDNEKIEKLEHELDTLSDLYWEQCDSSTLFSREEVEKAQNP